jgi:hypothetical protein
MELYDTTVFGPQFSTDPGYIAVLGRDGFGHVFGGTDWGVNDPEPVFGGPTLLLTLDLCDSRLSAIAESGFAELPLPSYLNCSVWSGKQFYRVDANARLVTLLHREVTTPEALDDEDRLPSPLPACPLSLRPMTDADAPTDESAYDTACEKFVGGEAFLRILGPPIWMHWAQSERCCCGSPMLYVAGIGYERPDGPGSIIQSRPFFIGEGVLYFFLCLSCQLLAVVSQPT